METEDLHRISWVRALCAAGATCGIRVGAGVSLREVAAAAGVSAATVHRWEAGSARPTGAHAIAYARALEGLGARRRAA